MKKSSMSLEKCVSLANRFVKEQGFCILAYDVIGSEELSRRFGAQKFFTRLTEMNLDVNISFKEYLVNSGYDSPGLRNRFEIYRGDMASACVSSSLGVDKIISYQHKNYPLIPLRWVVAKNHWDKILKKI